MLGREQQTGATESSGDLVKNEQHTITVTQSPQSPQILGMIEPHAAGTLDNGFDDHGGGFLMVRSEQLLHCRQILFIPGSVETAARSGRKKLRRQRTGKQGVHARHRVADRHGMKGVAMITTAHANQPMLSRVAHGLLVLEGHFHGHFNTH